MFTSFAVACILVLPFKAAADGQIEINSQGYVKGLKKSKEEADASAKNKEEEDDLLEEEEDDAEKLELWKKSDARQGRYMAKALSQKHERRRSTCQTKLRHVQANGAHFHVCASNNDDDARCLEHLGSHRTTGYHSCSNAESVQFEVGNWGMPGVLSPSPAYAATPAVTNVATDGLPALPAYTATSPRSSTEYTFVEEHTGRVGRTGVGAQAAVAAVTAYPAVPAIAKAQGGPWVRIKSYHGQYITVHNNAIMMHNRGSHRNDHWRLVRSGVGFKIQNMGTGFWLQHTRASGQAIGFCGGRSQIPTNWELAETENSSGSFLDDLADLLEEDDGSGCGQAVWTFYSGDSGSH